MNEPTIKQRDEAQLLGDEFGWNTTGYHEFSIRDLAQLIAHIRTEATNNALDDAVATVDACGNYYGRATTHECIDAINGLRVKADKWQHHVAHGSETLLCTPNPNVKLGG